MYISDEALRQTAAVAAIFAALGGIIGTTVTVVNFFRIKEIHVLFNSRMDQILELTKTVSRAEGRASQLRDDSVVKEQDGPRIGSDDSH